MSNLKLVVNHDTNPPAIFDILVTKEELAKNLSISKSFVNKLMSQEGLPYRKLGRAVRFSVTEVTAWLTKRSLP